VDDVLKGESGAAVLFFYLFPGFLGSLVYDFLVEGRKRENFERIIAALVLTLVSSVALNVGFGISLSPPHIGKDAPFAEIVDAFVGKNLLDASLLTLGLAIVLAFVNNSGFLYAILRKMDLSNKKSDFDVWSDMFNEFQRKWIVVRFDDGRSIIGWPKYYSKSGEPREFFIADASWLEPNETGIIVQTDVAGPSVYLTDFAKVKSIEMLK
jgi:Family of unknown function (DUF6338)